MGLAAARGPGQLVLRIRLCVCLHVPVRVCSCHHCLFFCLSAGVTYVCTLLCCVMLNSCLFFSLPLLLPSGISAYNRFAFALFRLCYCARTCLFAQTCSLTPYYHCSRLRCYSSSLVFHLKVDPHTNTHFRYVCCEL